MGTLPPSCARGRLTSFQAPALTVRFGRRVIAVGAFLVAGGDAALYLATDHGGSVAWLFPGLVLLGAGQGYASRH